MSSFELFNIAASAMNAQSVRLNTTASNMANAESALGADGKPYKAKQVVFQAVPMDASGQGQGVRVRQVVESAAPGKVVYDPKSPVANADGYVTMSNVDPVEEMVNMISASRAYQNNAEVMNTAKTLMQKTISLGQG